MKLKALILGAVVLPFAVAGGAQAADLAVADTGGACAAGAIAAGTACLTIGGHVREQVMFSPFDMLTKAALFVNAQVGNVSAKIKFASTSDATNFVLDTGSGLWAGMFFAVYDSLIGPGGGFTDNGARHPDSGGVNQIGAAIPMGGSTFKIVAAETKPEYADGSATPQVAAQWLGSMGGLAMTLAAGWVPRTGITGTWVAGSLGGTVGAAAWKFWAAWGNNARGSVTNRAPIAAGTTGSDWVVGAGAKLPLGGIFSVAADVSYENLAGVTGTLFVFDLNQQWTPNVDTKEEVSVENGVAAAFAWFNVAWNSG